MMNRMQAFTGCGALVALLLGCGGGGGGSTPTPPPPPTIDSFVAAKNLITAGQSTTLTAVFKDGQGSVAPTVGAVTSGNPVTVTPAADTTYTLTVTGQGSVNRTCAIQVVPAPAISEFTATPGTILSGQTVSLRASFSGGTAKVQPGDLTLTSGVPVQVSPTASTTYTLTVTNPAGAVATQTTAVKMEAFLVTPIQPANPVCTVNRAITFNAQAQGGANTRVSWRASAGTIDGRTGAWTAPATPQKVTITATAEADPRIQQSTVVDVVAAPEITAFAASTDLVQAGTPVQLSGTFLGGEGIVQPGSRTLRTGEPIEVNPLESTQYTLTVRNAAGDEVTATTHIEAVTGTALRIKVAGLPDTRPGSIRVYGPSSLVRPVTQTVLLKDLEPGTYMVSPSGIWESGTVYLAPGAEQFALQANEVKTVVVNYTPTTVLTYSLGAGVEPLEFVRIPAGSYTLGSPDGEGRSDEHPALRVTLGYDLWVGKCEVTQSQWQAVMGDNPSQHTGNGLFPVERMSWDRAHEFLVALNSRLGLMGDYALRLPSESEWEYVCRAGSTTRYFFGDDPKALDDYCVWSGNSGSLTTTVGSKLPNAWGLYDIAGNVTEWCEDDYRSSYAGYPADGTPVKIVGGSTTKSSRGGNYWIDASNPLDRERPRSATRLAHASGGNGAVGIRLFKRAS